MVQVGLSEVKYHDFLLMYMVLNGVYFIENGGANFTINFRLY